MSRDHKLIIGLLVFTVTD